MGGVAGGVAFIPAVPGLAPGAFMGPRARARGFYGSPGSRPGLVWVPGLAPGAFMGQGEGLPVRSSRPCKQAQAGCRSEACTE